MALSVAEDRDCATFAQAMNSAINKGSASEFNGLIDWDSIFDTALTGLTIPAKQRQDLITGLKSSTEKETGFTAQFLKNAKQGAQFKHLRSRRREGRPVVQYRMTLSEGSGGINYFDFVVKKSADGKVRAVDVYPYLSAEMISAAFRRGVLPIVASLNRSFVDKLLTTEKDYVRDVPKLAEIPALIAQDKNREALAQIKSLRPDTQKDKSVLLLRLRAAQNSDEKEYAAVLEDFQRLYPADPCLDLLLLDHYSMKKEFAKALEGVDRLDKAVGGDPYLNMIRAGLSEADGNLAAAEKFAERAIKEEPTLLRAHFYLIGITLLQKKYDATLAALKKQDQTFEIKYNDLTTVPAYAGFVKSPQYQEWLKYLAKKTGGKKAARGKEPAAAKEVTAGSKTGS